jgi:hypothetical protein
MVVLTVVVLTHQRATVHMAMLKITEEMRAAARKLLRNSALKFDRPDRDLLTAIADGKRKLIRADWWTGHFKVVDRIKLDKLQRMADPARNPNEHERTAAGRKLDEFKARRPPGMPPEPPPLPSRAELWERKLKRDRKGQPAPQAPPRRSLPTSGGGVNTKAAEPARGGVNAKLKRTGDRHLNKGDRHRPGYMRDYMRRRRAKLRP